MSFLPTPYTLQVRRREVVGEDYGNEIYGWGDLESWDVYGWGAPQTTEPKLAGHDRAIVVVEVYAPTDAGLKRRDKVILPGQDPGEGQEPGEGYDVLGDPEDYNNGPFGWQPGYVINLGRVEG